MKLWLHYLRPKHSLAHKRARENLSVRVLEEFTLSPQNIKGNFTLILVLKKIKTTIAAMNYIR